MRIHTNFLSHPSVRGVKTFIREPTYVLTFLLVVSPVAVFEVYLMDVCQPAKQHSHIINNPHTKNNSMTIQCMSLSVVVKTQFFEAITFPLSLFLCQNLQSVTIIFITKTNNKCLHFSDQRVYFKQCYLLKYSK